MPKTLTLSQIESEIEVHRLAIDDLRKQGIEMLTGKVLAEMAAHKARKISARGPVPADKPKAERASTPRSDSLPARLLNALARGGTFTADELIGELQAADKANQVRTTLCRMVKQGKIVSPDKGRYQAK